MLDFREFIGNVFVPNEGGLVGNNFHHAEPPDPEAVATKISEQEYQVRKSTRIKIDEAGGSTLHICSVVFCVPCTFKLLMLPEHIAYPVGHPHLVVTSARRNEIEP